MNPASIEEAVDLAEKTVAGGVSEAAELGMAVPFPFLGAVKAAAGDRAKIWAEDVFFENPPTGGAYTGEISFEMLKNLKIEGAIVGHSERRKYLFETNAMVNRKIHVALKAEQRVVLCVGEWQRRLFGKIEEALAKKFVFGQLKHCLFGVSGSGVDPASLLIVYEPVWAISPGRPAAPRDAQNMAAFVKESVKKIIGLNPFVLYGGSVNGENAAEFLGQRSIDGLLIGAASLKSEEMRSIINLVS